MLLVVALAGPLAVPWAISGADAALAGSGATAAGNHGYMRFERSGTWRELYLSTLTKSANVLFNVASDKVATGSGQKVVVVARRVRNVGEYRVVLRFASDGGVFSTVVRLSRGVRTTVGRSQRVGNVRHEPGSYVATRISVSGSSATVIKLRIWRAGTGEPTAWSRIVTDRSRDLARAGWLGLRFGVPRSSTNVPVTYLYHRVQVSTTDEIAPPPGETPAPTSPPTASPTSTPATPPPTPLPTAMAPSPTPTPTSSPTPTPTPSPTTTPTSTPTAPPDPTATPTAQPTSTPPPTPTSWPRDSYFVSPTGSDVASGSLDSPWRTLQKAANTVNAGATVYVRQGSYAGFTMRRSGTSTAPITFAAYPGESPVVDGKKAVAYTVRLVSVSHVHLVGLTVQGGFAERHAGGGVSIEFSGYVQVRDSVLRDNKAFGIRSYQSSNLLIEDNEITGNATGVIINHAGEGTEIVDNLIYDNTQMMVNTADVADDDVGGQAIALVRSTGRVLVQGNAIWGNRSPSYDYGYDGGAFAIHAASNWTITDNVTWDNRNVLETGTDPERTPCDNGTFTRNLNYGATTEDRTVGMVLRCASNTLVANNTFHGMQYFVFALSHNRGGWGASIEKLRLMNNIISISTGEIYRFENAMPSSVVIDNNLVRYTGDARLALVAGNGGTSSFETFRSWTGYERHGVFGDPRYVDVSANDYRLRADSPALDAGVVLPGVSDSFTGTGPDLGYREFR